MTYALLAAASVVIDESTLAVVLNEVLFDRLISFAVKLTILLFFVAFTVAVILNVYGRLQFPVALRKYVYGAYLALMVGAALSLRAGAPAPEASARNAAREITNVLLDSSRAGAQRGDNVIPEAQAEPAGSLPPGKRVVYVQIPNVATRDLAERVRAALKGAGYSVPGVEIVDPLNTPGTPEVRYFNAEDGQSAEAVAKIARDNGLPVPADKVKRQEKYKAPLGQIELWFARPQ